VFTHEGCFAHGKEQRSGSKDGEEDGPAEKRFIFGFVPAEKPFSVEEAEIEDLYD
jgi:hypothetical protein